MSGTEDRQASTGRRPICRAPTAGPIGSWEELALRQLRLLRMVELLIRGYSYRGIAREMGIARTTVMRMKPEAARFGVLSDGFESMITAVR